MKLKELIEQLTDLPEDCKDMDVRVWADHGQCYMKPLGVDVNYSMGDEYMVDGAYDDYEEFIEDTECKDPYIFICIS